MLGFILFLLVIGVVAGFLARLLVPGPDPMSVLQTIVLGIVAIVAPRFLNYIVGAFLILYGIFGLGLVR